MEHNVLFDICAIFGVATMIIIVCNLLNISYVTGSLVTVVLLSPNTSGYFAQMGEVDVYAQIEF